MNDHVAADNAAVARGAALLAVGVVLMFAAHVLAFLGFGASEGLAFRPPYWWGYLLLYPAAGAIVTRFTRAKWRQVAICLCLPPILYFFALGAIDARWRASDGALWGCILAGALTALVAFGISVRRPQ